MSDQKREKEKIRDSIMKNIYGDFEELKIYSPSYATDVILQAFCNSDVDYSFFYCDIDKLKFFNDSIGFTATNELIFSFLKNIRNTIR